MHGRNIRFGQDSSQWPCARKANTITTELKRILFNTIVRYCIYIRKQPCLKEWSPVTQQYFIFIPAASAPILAFLEFFQRVVCTIFFPSHCLLSHIIIVKIVREEWIFLQWLLSILLKNIGCTRGLNQQPSCPCCSCSFESKYLQWK